MATTGATAGAVFALMAALSWGGGDFSGGMGVKATGGTAPGALRVILAGHSISLCLLVGLIAVFGVHLPLGRPALWGLGSGAVAGLAVAAFYTALARGTMGVSAAISGLLAAALPAGVGVLLDGRPGFLRLVGFALAAAAIWLIASPVHGTPPEPPGVMLLAIGGGVGFGLYFVGLKFANPLGVLEPLALARCGSLLACGLLWAAMTAARNGNNRQEGGLWLNKAGWFWAIGVAFLDTGGNLFYIAATRAGRLDVAAVLASLYPASTILLAAALLGERPGRRQWAGMAVALAAVVLVTF